MPVMCRSEMECKRGNALDLMKASTRNVQQPSGLHNEEAPVTSPSKLGPASPDGSRSHPHGHPPDDLARYETETRHKSCPENAKQPVLFTEEIQDHPLKAELLQHLIRSGPLSDPHALSLSGQQPQDSSKV